MDEEKTIDEAVEQADEMKEFEPVAFDEVIKEEPERKDAPVLRDAPEPADMNMIHKHLDNFLAMLCGETPIDDNVRNSTEYWLKRLADGLGGSTKKIYQHNVRIYNTNSGSYPFMLSAIICNNSTDAITKADIRKITVLPVSGSVRLVGVTNNLSCSALLNTSTSLYLWGLDNSGTVHGGGINPIDILSIFESNDTTVADDVYAIN